MNNYTLIQFEEIRLSENFLMNEFFYPDYKHRQKDFPKNYYLDKKLILLPQLIRSFYKIPVNITSVKRLTIDQNFHYYSMAIDLQINFNTSPKEKADLISNINNSVPCGIMLQLLEIGITGYGFNDFHFHFDIRHDIFNRSFLDFTYCVFQEK